MRIAFDGKRAIQNFTGLGNYSRLIISLLCQKTPENYYFLYAPKRNESNPRIPQFRAEAPLLNERYPKGIWNFLKSAWRSWGISRQLQKDNIEIYHGLSGELPFNIKKCKNIKTVVTIHDLIFEHFPQYYKAIDRSIYSYKFRKACEDADKIIAISECTKRDIIKLYSISSQKIKVVYQGCDESFAQTVTNEQKAELKKLYNLPDQYILNVGTVEERKNALLIVKALKYIDDLPLIIVGGSTPYANLIIQTAKDMGLEKRVRIERIPFKHLPALYQMASVFAYPSRYEGFGIPILEALTSGTPVVAAKGSCLEEAGGPDSIYIHPDSEDELAEAINSILNSEEKRTEMISQGKEWAKHFSKENQAEGILSVYNALSSKTPETK